VVAIVDPVRERAQSLVEEYGLKALALIDVREIGNRCDGAIVATPNHTHCEVAVPLLEAGVSTLIEKPLATSVEEGQQIVEAARRGKARVAIGHYQRFLDGPRLLESLLRAQHFGRVIRFAHQFGTPGGWPAMSAYTLQRKSIGGGVLVVTGTHFLDRMLATWGMPDAVSLVEDATEGPEAHCELSVTYKDAGPGKMTGKLRYSKCVPLPAGVVLETESGVVMLRDGFEDRITVWSGRRLDLRSEIVCPPDNTFPLGYDPSQRMLGDFIQACRQGRAPLVDGEQGLAMLELIRRCYGHRQPLLDGWSEFRGVA